MGRSWNWEWQLEEWRNWLDERLEEASRCPGRQDARCCGIWKVADGTVISHKLSCNGGRWRELEDLEWFYRDADRLYGIVQQMVTKGDAWGAARFGIELGERLVQLELKLGPEAVWRTGRKIRAGLDEKRGSANEQRHTDATERRAHWQREALLIWNKNPAMSASGVAELLVRRGLALGATANTVRQALKKPDNAG
jgi:hypothetical protein